MAPDKAPPPQVGKQYAVLVQFCPRWLCSPRGPPPCLPTHFTNVHNTHRRESKMPPMGALSQEPRPPRPISRKLGWRQKRAETQAACRQQPGPLQLPTPTPRTQHDPLLPVTPGWAG